MLVNYNCLPRIKKDEPNLHIQFLFCFNRQCLVSTQTILIFADSFGMLTFAIFVDYSAAN